MQGLELKVFDNYITISISNGYLCPHQHRDKIHSGTSHKVDGKFINMANFQIAIVKELG
jgi:hypothetical protein